jgi:hypothetical protein
MLGVAPDPLQAVVTNAAATIEIARRRHGRIAMRALTLLPDGRVLVAGGFGSDGNRLDLGARPGLGARLGLHEGHDVRRGVRPPRRHQHPDIRSPEALRLDGHHDQESVLDGLNGSGRYRPAHPD